jgi:hypothetical protein
MARNRIIGTLVLGLGLLVGARDHEYDNWLVPMYTVLDRNMFPASWENNPREVVAYPLDDPNEPLRELKVMNRALHAYPPHLLENMDCIYIMADLVHTPHDLITMVSTDRIYIAIGEVDDRRGTRSIEGSVYWGVNGLLQGWHWRDADRGAWEKLNPPDFEYLGSGLLAMDLHRDSYVWNRALHEEGFLYEYAQASIDCDFLSIARELFRDRARFWRTIEDYPLLRAKTDLVIDFFHRLDPIYDEEFFRNEHGERRERLIEYYPHLESFAEATGPRYSS